MTELIHRTKIKVPTRQRKQMDESAFSELRNSISKRGLMHAVVLRDGDTLVAGERRLRAMMSLHENNVVFSHDKKIVDTDLIPCVHIESPDTIAALEMELEENLLREDLTWQDEVAAKAELHQLRTAQNPKQTFADTGREIIEKKKLSPTSPVDREISRAMLTKDFLDDPDVKNARNEKEAFNIASRKVRAEFAALLSARAKSRHTFLSGNALHYLPEQLPKSHFSCVILDPPYGIDAQLFGNAAQGRHKYNDSKQGAFEFNEALIRLCKPLVKDDGHLWLFCDIDLFVPLRDYCSASGWTPLRTPIVWNSGTSGHVPDQRVSVRRNYELLLFARKGLRGLAYMLDDVVNITSRGSAEGTHGAEKPTKLYELLLKLSCLGGDSVLDPTCGSGTIFRAAHSLNLNATGIELDKKYEQVNKSLLAELS